MVSPIDESPPVGETPDEDILSDRQVGQQPHLLVNQDDSGIDSLARTCRSVGLAFPLHCS